MYVRLGLRDWLSGECLMLSVPQACGEGLCCNPGRVWVLNTLIYRSPRRHVYKEGRELNLRNTYSP